MPATLSTLPPKIVTNIIEHTLVYQNDEPPPVEGWQKTRLICRAFKKGVEEFMVAHYLKYCGFYYDCGKHRDKAEIALTGSFDFEKLDHRDPSVAIALSVGIVGEYRQAIKDALQRMMQSQSNSNTDLVMQLRRTVCDVPPQDIEADFSSSMSEGKIRIRFNWFRTMTIYMEDQRQLLDFDGFEDEIEQLKQRFEKGQINQEQALFSAIEKFGETSKNKEFEVRRARQMRLLRMENPNLTAEDLASGCMLDEDRKMQRVRDVKMLVKFHEFSDESAGEEDTDNEEEAEWEDDYDDNDDKREI